MKNLMPTVFIVATLLLAGLVIKHYQIQALPQAKAYTAQEEDNCPLSWRMATPAECKAAGASIEAQLKAFQQDDYQKAVFFQSRALRQHFASATRFRAMIQGQYPEFADYKSVQFGSARADATGQHLEMPVTLTGHDGVIIHADYLMVREGKTYHVNGVTGGAKSAPSTPPINTGASQEV